MEGDNCSPHELRESSKQARDSSISGCFGWVRTWICNRNDLDSDEDFYERRCAEDSRDSSTGGCFESIRRWVRDKFSRHLGTEQETLTAPRPVTPGTATAQRPLMPMTATAQRRGEWKCVRDRKEGSHTATCSRGDHAGYTLHGGEAQCSVLNSVDAVEPSLKSAAENQGEAENSVSEGDENAQTLSLQASELKEMDPSATEARPLNASAKQERTEQLDEKLEPLRRQVSPWQTKKIRKETKKKKRGKR
ncbi:uncharacterized protein LOC111869261 [Cryptotermes secundus]|uniref:uncharacterized protein LOC111869261 n=1 Tax=Cryptotermes secundus TaxID=105785 RepID=UPI000CD7BCE1|nr:uncharacterized protein LOC111869261 [Cryptotermes secundus]